MLVYQFLFCRGFYSRFSKIKQFCCVAKNKEYNTNKIPNNILIALKINKRHIKMMLV